MSDNNNAGVGTIFLSFLAGATIGAGLALLIAPKPGRELRETIADLADNAVDKIKGYTTEAQERLKSTIDGGKELLKEKKTILGAAMEAGKDAMAWEKEKLRKQ
jgi:gas vesicle protein